MPGSLAEAFVEVGLRDNFSHELDSKVNGSLRNVSREAESTRGKVASSFKGAATSANHDLDTIEQHGKRSATSFGTFARVAGGAIASLGIVAGLRHVIEQGAEAAKVGRITNSVVQSTGGVAGVTAGQIGELSTRLSDLTGKDDDLIQANANVLLTFTNLRNGVGAGNDVFNQSVGLAQDMATVLGTDSAGAALQLGKALNDPVKGISALSRAGVSFTADQKEQIKTLMSQNDILGAQKIILGEVTKEFGGAAAAAADPLDRIKVAANNAEEALGQALLPIIAPVATALANFLTDHAASMAERLGAGLQWVAGAVGRVAGVGWAVIQRGASTVADAFSRVSDVLRPVVSTIGDLMTTALTPLGDWMTEHEPIVSTLAVTLGTFAGAIAGVALAMKGLQALSSVAGVLSAVAAAIPAAPFLLLAAAVVAIGAGAVYAYTHVEGFRNAVDGVASFLTETVWPVLQRGWDLLQQIGGGFADVGSRISDVVGSIQLPSVDLGGLFAGAGGAASGLADSISGSLAPVLSFVTGLWTQYGDEVTGILSGLGVIVEAVVGRVVDLLTNLADTLTAIAGPAFEWFGAVVDIALSTVLPIVVGLVEGLIAGILAFVDFMTPIWSALWGFASDVVSGAIGPIRAIVEGFLQVIEGFVTIIGAIFTGDWAGIWAGFSQIISGAVNIALGLFSAVLSFLSAVWSNALELITAPIRGGWAAAQTLAAGGWAVISGILNGALGFLSAIWSNATTLITAPISAAVGLVQGFIGQISAVIGGLPGAAANALVGLGSSIAGAIGSAATTALEKAGELVSSVLSKIGEIVTGIPGALAGWAGALGSALWNTLKGAWNAMVDRIPTIGIHQSLPWPLPDVNFDISPGDYLHLAQGGVVPGGLGLPVPAVVHGGELWLNPQQQSRLLLAIGNGQAGPTGAPTYQFNGPVTFGAETDDALAGLDWFARYQMGAA